MARAWLLLGFVAGFVASGAVPASAAVVSYEFTGEVSFVNDPFVSIVAIGSPAAGRFTYDTDAVDGDPDPQRGFYTGATLEFTIGSYAYAGEAYAIVYDDDGYDGFQIAGIAAGGDPIGGLALNQVEVAVNAGATLYASDALPPTAPSLGDPAVTGADLRIGIVPPGSGIAYQSAPLLTLPEAGGGGAVFAAAAALAALASRRGPGGGG